MTDADIYLSLTKHIVSVTKGLAEIYESSQEKAQSVDYNNILTAATFFSAVTATTLQLSYAYNTSTRASLGVAVHTLWFVALVFSTASSLNSLVGLTWYQKIRRIQLFPEWTKLWFEYGPTISLAIASAAFSAGLCLFAFSSSQHIITSTLVTAFTGTHAVALFVPLFLYSPNRLSRYLLRALTTPFSYRREACLRRWYLRRIPREDWDYVASIIHRRCAPWSEANKIYVRFSFDRAPNTISSTEVRRNIKKAWASVLSSVRSVAAWLVPRQSILLGPHRLNNYGTEESSNMEQTYGAGTSFAELRELERGDGPQEHAGEPEMPISSVTEDQGIMLSEQPQISTRDITDPDEGAALATKEPGKEVEHSSDTRATPRSTEEPTVATTSTAPPIPSSRLIPMARNSDNGPEDGARQAASTSGIPNTSREEELEDTFDSSVQEGVEAHIIDASNPTFKVERRRRVTFQEGSSPSADAGDLTNPNDRD
ncbi:hypothetical protein M0805_009480 [Coniferiporia weirii]|nr:hypothetical protein M0805_009480 [Coniferiporia weirii]